MKLNDGSRGKKKKKKKKGKPKLKAIYFHWGMRLCSGTINRARAKAQRYEERRRKDTKRPRVAQRLDLWHTKLSFRYFVVFLFLHFVNSFWVRLPNAVGICLKSEIKRQTSPSVPSLSRPQWTGATSRTYICFFITTTRPHWFICHVVPRMRSNHRSWGKRHPSSFSSNHTDFVTE